MLTNFSRFRSRSLARTVAVVAAGALLASSCGDDDSDDGPAASSGDLAAEVVTTYAEGVHAAYEASAASAASMAVAIDAFVADPTDTTLDGARSAWLEARDDYGPTEAFRFYGGPIDDEETGTEGLINAWPLDEAYIDYVVGAPEAGIINDPDTYPTIDAELLLSLNEAGGETNISTGWHAIEFLLWGQDLSLDGPGDRPVGDYTTADNAERRAQYLQVTTDVLIGHLDALADAWADRGDNYRAEFLTLETDAALVNIVAGVGELSRGELAGERMNVAYAERSQEDEHSCFSDNTTNDIIGNARGIEMVLTASFPGGVSGPSVIDLVAETDSELADQLRTEVAASLAAVEAIPAPFDQHLVEGASDDDPGRVAILNGIESLEDQTDTIVAAADAIGAAINVT